MADSWYYAHGDERLGPFSDLQLRELADAGDILTTDTVWKTGVEQGVRASRVRHLFPVPDAKPLEVAAELSHPITSIPDDESDSELSPPEPAPKPPDRKAYKEAPARRRTVTAGKGAIIMGQDGTQVKFKKQCSTCQHIDSSSATMKITGGSMKASFFCPNCRKRREVELRGN